jgi:hypothetical protein
MKRTLAGVLVVFAATTLAIGQTSNTASVADTVRITELNRYFAELSRTVREGDFEGYKATYHKDAVCVFTTGQKKRTAPIDVQLALWKPGIDDTKAGKTKNNVEFRFSQRVGDSTSAHETGIFNFTSIDKNGKVLASGYVHFEILLVKRNGSWLALMEYQKSKATQEEWDALKMDQ